MCSFSAIWEYKSFHTGIWVAFQCFTSLSTYGLIPSSIHSFVCWIIYGSGRGRTSLLAGCSTLLAGAHSLLRRWSKDFLQLWPLIVLPFLIPWSSYALGLNWKETCRQHASQDWPDCQSLTSFLMLPPLQMQLQLLSGWWHWAICHECWLASIKCSWKQVLSFKVVVYWLEPKILGGFGQSEK